MAIPLEGMVGYIRTRVKPGTQNKKDKDGKPAPELELWIDPNIQLQPGATGPVVTKPADCAGILYSVPGPPAPTGVVAHRLQVQYPE